MTSHGLAIQSVPSCLVKTRTEVHCRNMSTVVIKHVIVVVSHYYKYIIIIRWNSPVKLSIVGILMVM